MAPKFFDKLFKREHKRSDYRFRPREFWANAIGISDSTCEIQGDPFNGWKLPIPAPEQSALKSRARQHDGQQTSWFFRLPMEVRRMIYIELMGNRRVHIEHSWMYQSAFQPKSKRGGKRWIWWHGVCQNSDSFVCDTYGDRCWGRDDESYASYTEGLTRAPPGTKIQGVEWLSYEEALPVLYGTNVFVPREGIDSPFIMSRLIPPTCAQLIRSVDFTFVFCWDLDLTPGAKAWTTVYPALFDILEQYFSKVHSLRLTIKLPAWEKMKQTMSDSKLNKIVAPWETLARNRDWKRLEFCVPLDWRSVFTKRAETQSIWELTVTDWFDWDVRSAGRGCGM
ncbi:uncharacterized protein N7482_009854 [Penicillium canariense]|uniref:DUF7730 domain-containing protein n=1 Tax=Penicillium canariense TaxID=189055 RepID=A0A9W9HS43_9EURO|nr:uncharacterized protein N7482_009854 [Penicillium canariense]KAJ5153376.1 hypothetical protein N7482_009854 [Penicillium canariense]